MVYLVNSPHLGIKEFDNYDEVLDYVRQCTAFWCTDPSYYGRDFETIYKECLEEKNFHSIVQVFKVETYFHSRTINYDFPCGLSEADTNVPFKMTRIL